MDIHRSSLVSLLAAVLMPLSISNAQFVASQPNKIPSPRQPFVDHKNVIERHFESIRPVKRLSLGGAVAGARLLQQHPPGTEPRKPRNFANFGRRPAAVPGGSILPGIELRPYLQAGLLPTSVVTGDFDRDGHMDFIEANGLTNDLWLYLGKGDGTFQLPRIIPLSKGLTPVAIVTADLRGNGKLDLVVAEFDSVSIGVLLGNGDGTFGYESIYALPEPPEAIVVDDFNHDGKPDIAAAMASILGTVIGGPTGYPYIASLSGDGKGNFASPVITNIRVVDTEPWNIDSGDVNGDGLPDLLVTSPLEAENATIYLNAGDGTFRTGQTVMSNALYLTSLLDGRLVDINGDHCLDAVMADATSFVNVAIGDCSGNFAPPKRLPTGDSNAAVRVADVNGDGIPDIVTSSLPALNPSLGQIAGNTFSVILGGLDGNFSVARNYVGPGQAYSIGVADFNGDGKPDFVTANNDTDTVTVYQNDGAGGFGFPQGIFAGVPGQGVIDAPVSALSFADLNKDGKTDAFLLDEGYSGEYYATSFLNDGTGKFTGPIATDLGIANTANMLGDHRLGNFRDANHQDLIGISYNLGVSQGIPGFILFAPGNGDGTFGKSTVVSAAGADGILTTGDFNHDGKLDFVAVNGLGAHALTTFLGAGNGTFQTLPAIHFNDPGTTSPLRLWTGDFNRDSKLDVLLFTSANGYWTDQSTLWEFDGNGDGTFQTGRQLFTGFQPLVLADVNGDGNPDIARYDFMWPGSTTDVGPSKFTTYLGQADGSFTQSGSYAPYSGVPVSVQPFMQNGDPLATSLVSDLQGNGKPDLLAPQAVGGSGGGRYGQILMNNGDGTYTPTYDIFPFYLLDYPLYAHDLDGNGIADFVTLVGGTSSLQVMKGGRAPALQMELDAPIAKGGGGCGWVYPDVASVSSRSITFFSVIPGVSPPSSVTLPSGALSARFCYSLANGFDWRQVFDINAQLDGDTATAYASASYVLGFTESVSLPTTTSIYAGQSVGPLSVTLTAAPGYSSTVRLYCQGLVPGNSCQFGSDTLVLSPVAPASTTVTLVTSPNSATFSVTPAFTIVADDGDVLRRQVVNVNLVTLSISNFGADSLEITSPGSGTLQFNVSGIPPLILSCSGLPAGVTCGFPDSQNGTARAGVNDVTIAVPAGVVQANYPFQINVASGSYAASATATLQAVSLKVLPPSSADDWAIPGTTKNLSLTLQAASNWPSTSVQIACAVDVSGAVCNGAYVVLSSTAQTANVSFGLTLPANAAPGQHLLSVMATYAGTSQIFTFPFTVADFSGTLSASSITVARSSSGTVTATVNGTTGFSSQISLACSSVPGIACSFSPVNVQVIGGTPQQVTVTLTADSSATLHPAAPFPFREVFALALLLPLGLIFGFRQRRSLLSMILAGFVLFSLVTACGGGGGGGTSSGPGGGGSNSYSLTLSAVEANTKATRTLGTVAVTVTH